MQVLEFYDIKAGVQRLELSLFTCSVSAGFPSPADDYIDLKLDLNQYLIKRPASTFLVRVSGDSMINVGIHHGDILTVDRSITPTDGKIVIAVINGECTVKRIQYEENTIFLLPENDDYRPIEVKEFSDTLFIWGVVTNVIHPLL
jgi:DNA polymerase V